MADARPTTPPLGDSEASTRTITAAQKQALIDNLRLEVTDRARKLRAQYSVQTSSLKARLEMRINRIPTALRSKTMTELIEQYSENLEAKSKALPISSSQPMFSTAHNITRPPLAKAISSPTRDIGAKRSSAEMLGSDKENLDRDLSVPKKRTKMDAPAPTKTTASRAVRTGSRKINPSTVLSPKSHNSRTLPHSPLKPLPTAGVSCLGRPPSPIKPAAGVMGPPAEKPRSTRQRVATKASTTSTASVVGTVRRKPVAVPAMSQASDPTRERAASNSSASSSMSTTTVVNKKTTTKKGIIGKVTGMAAAAGRKAAGTKKETATLAETGRRVLRTRK